MGRKVLKPKLLFIDPVTPRPYTTRSLVEEAVGGTEATVVRVANALCPAAEVRVAVAGLSRTVAEPGGVAYVPLERIDAIEGPDPDGVVLVRKARLVAPLRRRYPNARLHLWMHNFTRRRFLRNRRRLLRADCLLISVSRHHMAHVRERFSRGWWNRVDRLLPGGGDLRQTFVPNPIADDLAPDGTAVRRDKLVFLSSPDKGLAQVRQLFGEARRRIPSLELFVLNPGYQALLEADPARKAADEADGIRTLGALPHADALAHVRESLCVFYPQTVYPETFGLIYAEANAVGTPVLAHDFGAAREVLCPSNPVLDCRQAEPVLRLLEAWHGGGRPQVSAREEFRLSRVAERWRLVLELDR